MEKAEVVPKGDLGSVVLEGSGAEMIGRLLTVQQVDSHLSGQVRLSDVDSVGGSRDVGHSYFCEKSSRRFKAFLSVISMLDREKYSGLDCGDDVL